MKHNKNNLFCPNMQVTVVPQKDALGGAADPNSAKKNKKNKKKKKKKRKKKSPKEPNLVRKIL